MEKLLNQKQRVAENLILLKKKKMLWLAGLTYLYKDEKYGKNKSWGSKQVVQEWWQLLWSPQSKHNCGLGRRGLLQRCACHWAFGPSETVRASTLSVNVQTKFSVKDQLWPQRMDKCTFDQWKFQEAVWKMERYFINGLLPVLSPPSPLWKIP